MFVVFQKDDEKTRMWAAALQRRGADACALGGSPIAMPVKLLGVTFRRGRPRGFFFRYLSDYPGLVRTLLRALSEVCVVLICRTLRIPVFWICHNVDHESVETFPRITRFRRRLIAASSQRVFVMDPLLLPYAADALRPWADRLDFLTFGEPPSRAMGPRDAVLLEQVLAFCAARRHENRSGNRVLIALCVGESAGVKCAHFEYVPELIGAAARLGIDLSVVVAGDLEASSPGLSQPTWETLNTHPNVFFWPYAFSLDERQLAGQIDFIWRGYRDISVAYTLYAGASIRRPILALAMGFVAEAVNVYGLGTTVQPGFGDLGAALQRLQHWNSARCEEFLAGHNWDLAAERILKAVHAASHASLESLEVSGR